MDDEPELGEVTGHILNVMGYYVQVARDGMNAVEIYKEYRQRGQSFNLVIMDASVPGGLSAIEAARRILEFDPDAYLVVSSGFSNDPLVTEYNQWGFRGFIVKPYGMVELAQLLEHVARGTEPASDVILS